MGQLLSLDRELFLLLNGAHSPFWDSVMGFSSAKLTWIPFYLLLLYCVWRKLGVRNLLWFVLCIAITVTLADQLSVHLFKNTVQRLRPCHAEELAGLVRLPNGRCGGRYGFVSSHATNVFAVAVVSSLYLRMGWLQITMFLWALLVSYSRIYMGVHYPGDVICGGLFGALVGLFVYWLARRVNRRRIPPRWQADERSHLL